MTWTTQPRSEGAGDLAYFKAGKGPALVLIHGVGLRAEAWGAIIPLLSDYFTIYAVDMPGHGQSPLGDVSALSHYANRVLDMVDTVSGPIFIAGHSMGAVIALDVAHQRVDRIAGIAAINAIYRRSKTASAAVKARAAEIAAKGSLNPGATLDRWFGEDPQGPLHAASEACEKWLTGADPKGYATAYGLFASQDGPNDAVLTALPMPALFITADGDLNSTPKMSQAMARLAPKGRAISVPEAAHMLPMTHPEHLAKAILDTFEGTVI
ncbi:alpha/beta hydrolase [Sulfitobacter sp. TSTF-M16]|uniref:Alpha/beta hydrolase n=1 Tax=Sulfitobacter aestuariivivens TaxID=2766981 RepID=A0A927HGC6_9RHOB|nr:alpha/beta hydrolase [Sulfitobacter aestuariivivens]MBD3665334.1 alpha/beta hydrolase [Sulfitobacter aestuariivivens]